MRNPKNLWVKGGRWLSYDPTSTESKWRGLWKSQGLRQSGPGKTSYVLAMFPYPSGALHMGHVRVYTISDTIARYRRMKGDEVLHPMGWDAFGLPAENAARERGIAPKDWTLSNIEQMRKQLDILGFDFNWENQVYTCNEKYYKWTQWIFLQMFKKGLAYKKPSLVNWDPVDETVLANEQVDAEGRSWRSGAKVEQRSLEQWFLRITDYADALEEDLEKLDGWPNNVKALQKAWIGRSEGALVKFHFTHDFSKTITVFTTKIETLFGVSFIAVSMGSEYAGQSVHHCLTGGSIPIVEADYVLSDYGTGAVMGVPAHDERDAVFSLSKGFVGIKVIENDVLINSGEYSGMPVEEGRRAILQALMKQNIAEPSTSYRLRDWLVSRQRKWGAPIPIIHCSKCGDIPVPEEELPVLVQDFEEGENWKNVQCYKCNSDATRDTDTLDTFVDSSWYFLRYPTANDDCKAVDMDQLKRWMPVSTYIGGIEHAILHLLYSRFITKFLHNEGLVPCNEPFDRLLTQGMVHGPTYKHPETKAYLKPDDLSLKDGHMVLKSSGEPAELVFEKMSKSKWNGISPETIVEQYGADTTRLFTIFKAPPEKVLDWDEKGVQGQFRWLQRLWVLVQETRKPDDGDFDPRVMKLSHKTIQEVTRCFEETFALNTAVSSLMKLSNAISNLPPSHPSRLKALELLLTMLGPMAPFFASEALEVLENRTQVNILPLAEQKWPITDEFFLSLKTSDTSTIVIQINGKKKYTIEVDADLIEDESSLTETVVSYDSVRHFLSLKGISIQKSIYVKKGGIINLVCK